MRACLASLAASGLVLVGCTSFRDGTRVAVEANDSFARGRNNVLLLNVLRAAAREPFQFSAPSSLATGIETSGELTLTPENILDGGRFDLIPGLTLNRSVSPTLTVAPLGTKDFTLGIVRPMDGQTLSYFLNNGWDASFLLPLVVGAVVCDDGRVILNSGKLGRPGTTDHRSNFAFYTAFAGSAAFRMIQRPGRETQQFIVDEKDALTIVKDGLGKDASIESLARHAPGKIAVRVKFASTDTAFVGLDVGPICNDRSLPVATRVDANETLPGSIPLAETPLTGIPSGRRRAVLMRSVSSVIYYLGESHRTRLTSGSWGLVYVDPGNEKRTLFRIEVGNGPHPAAAEAMFHGSRYHIPQLTLGQPDTSDRTLKTLTFLDQLIALQTSAETLRTLQPIVAIGN